jgi:integrase
VHRKRFLSSDKLARLGALLAEGRASNDLAVRTHASAITLLFVTGCRSGETLSLPWSNLRGLRLNLRDSKTGPRSSVWLGQEGRAHSAARTAKDDY